MPAPQRTELILASLRANYGAPELAERNARARPVPRHYRTPELEALQPWQRALLFDEARRHARRNPWSIAALLGWVALCTLVWQFGFDGRTDGGVGPIYVFSALVPQMVLLNLATRHELGRLARLAARDDRSA